MTIPMPVSEARLADREFIAKGGFGEVYRIRNFTLKGDGTPLAYKKFTTRQHEQGESARAVVAFRDSRDPAARAELDAYSVWPRELVTDDQGRICGLLMPEIPPDFFVRQADPKSPAGQLMRKPCSMQWLIATEKQRQAAQLSLRPAEHSERLLLLAQLTFIIGRLHKQGWVFGDLSFNNVMFALEPPRIMLVDCDGAAALADPQRSQFSTPFWEPPECGSPGQLQDAQTDCYKLGLAILRCLTPGSGASNTTSADRLAGRLSPEGVDLVRRTIGKDRSWRLTARELYSYLKKQVSTRVRPPVIARAALRSAVCLRGQEARIDWQVDGATEIVIRVGHRPALPVDPAQHPAGYHLPPDISGPVTVEARNRYGQASADLGELTVFELPPITVRIEKLPLPKIMAMAPFCPDPQQFALPERLLAGIGSDGLPPVSLPSAAGLLDGLFPAGREPVAWPQIEPAMRAATTDLTESVHRAVGEFEPRLRQAFEQRQSAGVPVRAATRRTGGT